MTWPKSKQRIRCLARQYAWESRSQNISFFCAFQKSSRILPTTHISLVKKSKETPLRTAFARRRSFSAAAPSPPGRGSPPTGGGAGFSPAANHKPAFSFLSPSTSSISLRLQGITHGASLAGQPAYQLSSLLFRRRRLDLRSREGSLRKSPAPRALHRWCPGLRPRPTLR